MLLSITLPQADIPLTGTHRYGADPYSSSTDGTVFLWKDILEQAREMINDPCFTNGINDRVTCNNSVPLPAGSNQELLEWTIVLQGTTTVDEG